MRQINTASLSWYEIYEAVIGLRAFMSACIKYRHGYRLILIPNSTNYCDFSNKQIVINPMFYTENLEGRAIKFKRNITRDFLAAKALIVHEAGHVKYSDIFSFTSRIHKLVSNLLEDSRTDALCRGTSYEQRRLLLYLHGIIRNNLKSFDEYLDTIKETPDDPTILLDLLLRKSMNDIIPIERFSKFVQSKWKKSQEFREQAILAKDTSKVEEIAYDLLAYLGIDPNDKEDKSDDMETYIKILGNSQGNRDELDETENNSKPSQGQPINDNKSTNKQSNKGSTNTNDRSSSGGSSKNNSEKENGSTGEENSSQESGSETLDSEIENESIGGSTSSKGKEKEQNKKSNNGSTTDGDSRDKQTNSKEGGKDDKDSKETSSSEDSNEQQQRQPTQFELEDQKDAEENGDGDTIDKYISTAILIGSTKAGIGSSGVIHQAPYMDLLDKAYPIARMLENNLKTKNPNVSDIDDEDDGRLTIRNYVRDKSIPYILEGAPNIGKPKMVISLVLDRSISMKYMMNDLRLVTMAIHIACMKLKIPLSIFVLEGAVQISNFNDMSSDIYGLIAGLYASGGTLTLPTIEKASKAILKREESKKQIILIHDGEPADYTSFIDWRRSITKQGVEVTGIYLSNTKTDNYILTSLIELFGEHNYMCCSVEDVPRRWAHILKTRRFK